MKLDQVAALIQVAEGSASKPCREMMTQYILADFNEKLYFGKTNQFYIPANGVGEHPEVKAKIGTVLYSTGIVALVGLWEGRQLIYPTKFEELNMLRRVTNTDLKLTDFLREHESKIAQETH